MRSTPSITGRLITRGLRRLAAEPLMQFLAVGAVLLIAQQALPPAAADEGAQERITVSQPLLDAMHASFVKSQGRAPSEAELRALVDQRVDAEVLYREALRVGLHREDVIVRREMERKMRFLIEDLDPLPEPRQEELQAWLDSHAERYAQPQRVSFEQVFLSRARHGDQILFVAGQRLTALRAQPDAFRSLSDPFPAGLVVVDADRRRLEKDFGAEFAGAVLGLQEGQWSEPVRSSLGLHMVRVTARLATRAVSVGEAGKALVVDVRAAQREAANRRALDKLRARYRVELDGSPGASS